MKRTIGVNSNCYHGYSVEDALEGIAAAGFHYVELTATKGWTEHVFPSQTFEYLDGIREKMKELKLVPFAMSGHCNLMDRERDVYKRQAQTLAQGATEQAASVEELSGTIRNISDQVVRNTENAKNSSERAGICLLYTSRCV